MTVDKLYSNVERSSGKRLRHKRRLYEDAALHLPRGWRARRRANGVLEPLKHNHMETNLDERMLKLNFSGMRKAVCRCIINLKKRYSTGGKWGSTYRKRRRFRAHTSARAAPGPCSQLLTRCPPTRRRELSADDYVTKCPDLMPLRLGPSLPLLAYRVSDRRLPALAIERIDRVRGGEGRMVSFGKSLLTNVLYTAIPK